MEDYKGYQGTGYLARLTEDARHKDLIVEGELESIQAQLWRLLAKQTERYTMGDSSSVPIETAEELLRSISFTIGSFLRTVKTPELAVEKLKNTPLEQIFKEGQQVISEEISLGRKLYREVLSSALAVDNISYVDTIASIGSFFKKYDYRFKAEDIPCDIDYQLAMPVPELYGIEYINEYLTRLLTENKFCSYFNAEDIVYLLRGYCPDYKEQLINIFEPVFANALGLKLLDRDIKILDISPSDREILAKLLSHREASKIKEMLYDAAAAVFQELQLKDEYSSQYLNKASEELASRIACLQGHGLQGIFISFKEEQQKALEFIEGELMEDEALRSLIDELQQCRYLSDKLSMVKRQIHSLGDLVEVLECCFFDEELTEVFKLFSREELAVLYKYADEQGKDYGCQWVDILKEYMKKI